MQYHIGTPVMAEDGRAGTLDRLIYDPATDEIRGIVVLQGGLLPHDVVVPQERVVAADSEGVRVRGTVEEIASLEGFSQAQFTAPPEDWMPPAGLAFGSPYFLFPASPYAVGAFAPAAPVIPLADEAVENKPTGSVDLSAATEVYCTDGHAGSVDRVITDDGDEVTHLIVRRGNLLTREITVPAALIATTDEQKIYLTISQEDLDRLPEFEE